MIKRKSLEEMKELFPIGKIYGKWIVSGEIYKNKRNKWSVICNCECGRTDNMEIECENLLNGKRNKCKKCANKSLDYTNIVIGSKWGKWIVASDIYEIDNHCKVVLCSCECGRISNSQVLCYNLLNNISFQCSKCSREEVVNNIRVTVNKSDKFGKWKVVKPNIIHNGKTSSLCQCECGNELIIQNTLLINNKTKQCSKCAKFFAKKPNKKNTEKYKIELFKKSPLVQLKIGEEYKGAHV